MDCSRRRRCGEEEEEEEVRGERQRERERGREGEDEDESLEEEEEGSTATDAASSSSSSLALWLRALEVQQAMGACRSDERSLPCLLSLPLPLPLPPPPPLLLRLSGLNPNPNPNLNLNLCLPGPAAQDRLLAHLTQLLELSEIGLLLRCLCAPLVSIRVGKINRLGNLLCPIPSRYTFFYLTPPPLFSLFFISSLILYLF